MAKFNKSLLKMAMDAISESEKQAFVPAPPPGGGGAPMDPAMAGGPPMDPSMAGGAPMDPAMMDPAMAGGAPPMDPAMLAAMMDPAAMAGGAPAAPASTGDGDIKAQIKQVLEETGVIKPEKKKPEQLSQEILDTLQAIKKHLGIQDSTTPTDKPEEGSEGSEDSEGAEGTMSPGNAGNPSGVDLTQLTTPAMAGQVDPGTKTAGHTQANKIQQAIARLNQR